MTFHSQFGEDRVLNDFFGGKTDGFYLEIGAYDGVDMSNTFHFESLGWKGILVEADPTLAAQCRTHRPGAIIENCAAVAPANRGTVSFDVVENNRGLSSLGLSAVDLDRVQSFTGGQNVQRIEVPARTIDEILESNNVTTIDFVTIDVEGHEWGVLQGFTLSRWRPRVVIVERNHTLPDKNVMRCLHDYGYRFKRTTGVNDWFFAGSGRRPGPMYFAWLGATYYLPKYQRGAINQVRRKMHRRAKPAPASV